MDAGRGDLDLGAQAATTVTCHVKYWRTGHSDENSRHTMHTTSMYGTDSLTEENEFLLYMNDEGPRYEINQLDMIPEL